jgi:WD40 repeat protein/predicted chitinase/peptidoglycan hydrolase-like protein with peptidoglycan-binding domain
VVDVTKELLTGVVARPSNEARAKLWDAYVEALASPAGKEILAKYELDRNPARLAMILANMLHETGGFSLIRESMRYSADRLLAIFGRAAGVSLEEAERLALQEEEIAERVYGLGNPRKARQLGNTEKGDGWRYRGGGFLQTTGRENYRTLGRRIGVDLEREPERIEDALVSLAAACVEWHRMGLNELADRGDFRGCCNGINYGDPRRSGDPIGFDDRLRYYRKCAAALGLAQPARSLAPNGPDDSIEVGDFGVEVESVQRRLIELGYWSGEIDGLFTTSLRAGVLVFQSDHGLPTTGHVDGRTRQLLLSEDARPRHVTAPTPVEGEPQGSARSATRQLVPPSEASEAQTSEAVVEEKYEWWHEPDVSLELQAARTRALAPAALRPSDVSWADDAQHPDYHHLDASFPDQEFEFTAADLELVIRANRFEPTREQHRILFGLRGAELVSGSKASGPSLRLRLARPNHRDFRCVIGVYNTDTNALSGYIGSTVPWYAYVHDFYQRGGQEPRTNILPTGCYPYFVGPHGAHQIPGCFRLGTGFGDNQQERVAVLRTLNDVTYNTEDAFDLSIPHDNLHPSFGARIFQSRGCQTVRGTYSGRHTGEWAEFRLAVGLQERGDNGRRFDYVLVTGLEAAIASKLRRSAPTPSPGDVLERLTRLRHGSRGELVVSLQQKLGLKPTGLFGAAETKALAELERKRFGGADGVYSPELDKRLGFGVYRAGPIVVTSRARQILPGASRIALVMGVGAYAKAPPLTNPKHDAAAIAERLTRLGFGVTLLTDETQSELLRAIEQFGDSLARSEVGFIYFAGHGVQIEGENYLLPKDAEVDGELKLRGSAIALGSILDVITRSQKAGIVFLDCCRDNPFGGRAGARALRSEYRGLAKIDAPRGTFIAFSTAPGLTASDGVDGAQNSPFTSSVLNHIETTDLRISDLMLTVRQEVYAATGGQQLPWENSSLLLPFSFNQKKQDLGGPEDLAKANREREDAHWRLAEQSENPELLESFVTLYPYSRNRALADNALRSMRNRRLAKRVGLGALGALLAVAAAGIYSAREYEKGTRHTYQAIQSEFLAERSLQQTVERNDPGTGLLLALEGLRDLKSQHHHQRDRPPVAAAARSLETALRALREVKTLTGHSKGIYGVAVAPDGRVAVSGSDDDTARIWDLNDGKELAVLEGHKGRVYSVAVTRDGTRVVTGSQDRTAQVWDAKTGKLLKVLQGKHKDLIYGVAVTPDGKRAVTASWDRTAWVWDLEKGEALTSFKQHKSDLNGVAVSPDGLHAATASDDKTARIWKIETGAGVHVLEGHTDWVYGVAFDREGAKLVTGSRDRTARIWDTKTGKALMELKGHTGPVYSVAITPDGARVVTSSADDTIRIWNIATGGELAVLRGHRNDVRAVAATRGGLIVSGALDRTLRAWNVDKPGVLALRGHEKAIKSVAFFPNGRRLVTASEDKTARIWDSMTGDVKMFAEHGDTINSIAVTPDGTRVVTGSADQTARVWDAATGKLLAVTTRTSHEGDVNSIAVSADGTHVATGASDKTARLWDLRSGKQLRVFEGHADIVFGVALTPDGTRLVTASFDKTARVWDTGTVRVLAEFKGHEGEINSLAVTPNGKLAVTGSNDSTARVWDIETGVEKLVLRGHQGPVYGVALTPDGTKVVTASRDTTARVWDIDTGRELAAFRRHTDDVNHATVTRDGKYVVTSSHDRTARIWDIVSGKELRALELPDDTSLGVRPAVYGAAVTPDGTRVITGSDDGTARVWDFQRGKELHVLRGRLAVYSVAVTRDGRHFIAGMGGGIVRIGDIETGDLVASFGGHDGAITGVAATPDGSRFVTTSRDGTARVWETKTGDSLRVFGKHESEVNGVAVTGTRAVTVSGGGFPDLGSLPDNTARIWDLQTGKQIHVLRGHRGKVTSVAVTPDGTRAVTGSDDRTVRVWDISSGLELSTLQVGGLVAGVAVRPDGKRVAIGLTNKMTQVWDLMTGKQLHAFAGHQGSVTSVAFPPEGGSFFATGSDDASAIVWNAEDLPKDQQLIDRAKELATRCLTDKESKDIHLPEQQMAPLWCTERGLWPYDRATSVAALLERAEKHLQSGEKHLREERLPDARAAFDEAKTLNPKLKDYIDQRLEGAALKYNSIAWDHFLKRELAEGLPHAQKGLLLAPDQRDILDTRGQIYLGLNKVEEAFADLDKAIAKGLRAAGTFYGRGLCYERKGRTDEAIADYRRALAEPAFAKYDKDAQGEAQERLTALGAAKGPGGK